MAVAIRLLLYSNSKVTGKGNNAGICVFYNVPIGKYTVTSTEGRKTDIIVKPNLRETARLDP